MLIEIHSLDPGRDHYVHEDALLRFAYHCEIRL